VVAHNERVARFLAANGVDRIVFGPGGPRTPGGTSLDDLKAAAATIDEAAWRCHDLGVRACVHPHLGTEIENRHELDVIMELTDPSVVGLTIDSAHVTAAGMDATEVIRTYASRLDYLHLKDLTPVGADDPEVFPILAGNEALPIFCELGLGTVDLPGVFAALADISYDGWVTVEIDQSTSTPKNSLRVCRDWLVEHGISIGVPA
jgi:inosose dehydratase